MKKMNGRTAFLVVVVVVLAVIASAIILSPTKGSAKQQMSFSQNVLLPKNIAVSTVLPIPYISAGAGWPPVIQHSATAYSCAPTTTTQGASEVKHITY